MMTTLMLLHPGRPTSPVASHVAACLEIAFVYVSKALPAVMQPAKAQTCSESDVAMATDVAVTNLPSRSWRQAASAIGP